ncbi:MAG: hypothetical protein Q9174_000983 [Haloplaca sp. 1 TL-2023]
MFRKLWLKRSISLGCKHYIYQPISSTYSDARPASTSSAILKGLRKSKQGRSKFELSNQPYNTDKKNGSRAFADTKHDAQSSTRLASTRHNDRQSDGVTKRNLTLRERRILNARNAGQSDGEPHLQRTPSRGRGFERRPGHLMGSSKERIATRRSTAGSTTLNRAERRAAMFGHKESPPDGYKALQLGSNGKAQSSKEGENHRAVQGYTIDRTISHVRERFSDRKPRLGEHRGTTQTVEQSSHDSGRRLQDATEERFQRKSSAPLAIPYTTPASDFLYGHSVVTSALRSSRRKFYKLYLYNGDQTESRGQDREVRKLALAANVEVTRVGNDWLKLMDKMSGGRPHNGYILEASPLPRLPIAGLREVPNPQPTFDVLLAHQTREEEAVNGTQTSVQCRSTHRRFPFLLFLDGIRDPGNLGAILRSAHFLGADGIIICTRNSAPFSPVALKAAVGAAETLPLFSVGQPGEFIDTCQKHGWKVYAAVSPSSSDSGKSSGRHYYSATTLGSPTQRHPCIIILGSEGEGLRWNIQKKANYLVGIEPVRAEYGDVDSLNVSVAAALLCDAFLKRPAKASTAEAMLENPASAELDEPSRREDLDVMSATAKKAEIDASDGSPRLF